MATPTVTTVTTRHLADALAEQHQLTKKQGAELLNDLIGMITKHLKAGERVKIAGLGILQVRNRAARMGRNPATGEALQIKASKKVAFRASRTSRRPSDRRCRKLRAHELDYRISIKCSVSALPSKADMCALGDVRFVPEADSCIATSCWM